MNTWFTVEKIDNDTFAISEYKHWEEPHCYLLCGTESAVLIDTGLGVANIREVVEKLTDLPILVVTTHAHWDHIGSHKFFENIAVHELERAWLEEQFPLPLEVVKQNLMRDSECCLLPKTFCVNDYEIFKGEVHRTLRDGDFIELGNRQLQVLHTPGHSPGHCCFYEKERGYLYSGDLIYSGCLDAFYPTTDPYAFWKSVQRVQNLKINRILPGHHSLDIPVDIIHRIERGFGQLEAEGRLKQGSGMFEFEDFQIHI